MASGYGVDPPGISALSAERDGFMARALEAGPAALVPRERRVLSADARCMAELHQRVWELEDPARAEGWGRPGWR